MAKEQMPTRGTRSIPLAGGMQDDVPEFVQESPTLPYIENGRFRKLNEVEKTLPESDISPPTPPSGNAVAIETAGNTLLAIGDAGVQSYTEAGGWKNLPGRTPKLTKNSDVCSSAQAGGGMHFDWAKSTYADTFFVIAYETRSATETGASDFILGIETFAEDGSLISKKLIRNGFAPRVSTTGDGRVVVHYVLDPGFPGLRYLQVYDTTTETSTQLSDGAPLDIAYENLAVDAVLSGTSTVANEFGPLLNTLGHNGIRMGLQPAGNNCWYFVSYPGVGEGDGFLLYCDATDNYRIWLTKVDNTGLIPGGAPKWMAVEAAGTPETTARFPLALHADPTFDQVWVLWGQRDALANESSLYVQKHLSTLVSPPLQVLVQTGEFTVVNAVIVSSLETTAKIAYTRITGDEGQFSDAGDGRVTIRFGRVVASTWIEEGRIPHHTLTSTNLEGPAGTSQYFVCEQLNIAEPFQDAVGATLNVVNPPLAGLKASTAILVEANLDGTVDLLSTFDATTSKHSNFVMQEQNPFLGTLRFDNNDLLYCNRQLLQKEDFSKRMTSMLDVGHPFPQLLSQCLYMGEWRGNLFRVDLTPSTIQTTRFGDSVILNTGIPLWFSGGELTEMSVLEQPEIRDVNTASGDRFAAGYLEALSTDVDQWSQYQIVVGYVDSNGQAHRSAPSFPYWVWGVNYKNSNDQTKELAFTRPLTLFADDTAYFIEVYSAIEGEPPSLAYRTQLSSTNSIRFVDQQTLASAEYPATRTSESVYTLGGELGADPWPAFNQAVITSRRMFAIEEDALYFSKLLNENIAPEFSTGTLVIPFGRGRDLLAIGKIDDKILVFEDDTIHAVYGSGPDNTGQGQPFIVDHLQTTVGCSDPESVVEIPEGLIFFSSGSEEFHLIDRDLNIQNIGGAVQDLTAGINVHAAVVFPKESEVRWYVSAPAQEEFGPEPDEPPTRPPRPRYTNVLPPNPVLVYNYDQRKWTVLSEQPAVSATLFGNEVARLQSNWGVFRTSEEWANSKLLKYRLPWVRVEALQNFGRIREIALLGKYLSSWKDNGSGHEAGDIQITCRYDYEANGLNHVYRYRSNVDLDPLDGDRLQFGFKPGKPKCQAVQLTVEEVPTTRIDENEPVYTNGRGFVLSGLDLIYSLKRGLGLKSLGQRRSK